MAVDLVSQNLVLSTIQSSQGIMAFTAPAGSLKIYYGFACAYSVVDDLMVVRK